MNLRRFLLSALLVSAAIVSAGLDDLVFPGDSVHTVRELLACAELPAGEVLLLEELDALSPRDLLEKVTERLLPNFTLKNSFVLQCLQLYYFKSIGMSCVAFNSASAQKLSALIETGTLEPAVASVDLAEGETVTAAICMRIILAQTFGIAPASEFKFGRRPCESGAVVVEDETFSGTLAEASAEMGARLADEMARQIARTPHYMFPPGGGPVVVYDSDETDG